MSDISEPEPKAPFMVRLFCRTGSFYRRDEFASHSLPPFVYIYTWSSCTIRDLALELADAVPSALPTPSIGTRLAFQLVCPDLRGSGLYTDAEPRFAVKELGSVVIGGGGPGAESDDISDSIMGRSDGSKTLQDAHFVVGDFINCAVLPPLPDGSVAAAVSAKPTSAPSHGRGAFSGRGQSYNHGPHGGRRNSRYDQPVRVPRGDWMRGEQSFERDTGRSGWRGRGRGRW